MELSFEQYAAGKTKIAPSNGLVLGFMVQTFESETLYAIHNDGRVMQSEIVARPNAHFNTRGRKWARAETVPNSAGFIGHYPADMF